MWMKSLGKALMALPKPLKCFIPGPGPKCPHPSIVGMVSFLGPEMETRDSLTVRFPANRPILAYISWDWACGRIASYADSMIVEHDAPKRTPEKLSRVDSRPRELVPVCPYIGSPGRKLRN